MQQQIDSALAGLMRIRERLAGADSLAKEDMIGHDLEWAASHLEDIRHIWSTLNSRTLAKIPGRAPRIVAVAANQGIAR